MKDQPTRPELLRGRLIGFFDILGFSQRLQDMELFALHHLYAELIDDARSTVFNSKILGLSEGQTKANFDRASFLFDSIVLVSRELSSDFGRPAIHDFLMSCSTLLEKSFAKQLPLRGVIGFGDYLEDDQRNIFLSREFAEMVRTEKAQDWSGCVVLRSAEKQILPVVFLEPNASTHYEHQAQVLALYKVPFKTHGNSESGERASASAWCVNWVYFLDQADLEQGLQFLKGSKRSHTERFIRYITQLPDEVRPLPKNFSPAVRLLAQGTLGGVRIKFLDEDGRGVDPPQDAALLIKLIAGSQTAVFQGPPIPDPENL